MTTLHRTRAFFHFIGRLLYRLSRWGNAPLSEEQLKWMRRISAVAEYKRGYNDALEKVPIARVVQPLERHTDPTVLHLPTGTLTNAWHGLKVTGVHPTITAALRSIKLTPAGPRYTRPLQKPGDDDAWLNSTPQEPTFLQAQAMLAEHISEVPTAKDIGVKLSEATEEYPVPGNPALSKLLYQKRPAD